MGRYNYLRIGLESRSTVVEGLFVLFYGLWLPQVLCRVSIMRKEELFLLTLKNVKLKLQNQSCPFWTIFFEFYSLIEPFKKIVSRKNMFFSGKWSKTQKSNLGF